MINNAYGLQDSKCAHIVNEAMRIGEVTFVIQSTDKVLQHLILVLPIQNLLVPVGGAIVSSPNKAMVKSLSQIYPGTEVF